MPDLTHAAWRLREQLRPDMARRSQACGRQRYVRDPVLRATRSGCFYEGVIRCRARICPACFLSRRQRLLQEVHFVTERRSQQLHRQPLLATLTVRHSSADGVAITKAVRTCWSKFIAGKHWTAFAAKHGVEWICAEEITSGANGWHPHLHVALLPSERPHDIVETRDWWSERWRRMVMRYMGGEHEPDRLHGFDLRFAENSDYVAKLEGNTVKLAFELTDAANAKGSSAVELVKQGRKDKYLELQRIRHRARDVTWSRGLRPLRDEFAELEGPEPEPVGLLAGSTYERLASHGFEALLSLTRSHNPDEIRRALAAYNLRAEALGVDAVNAALARGTDPPPRGETPDEN